MIITKSKNCTQCPGKVRLVPFADVPVDGQARIIQSKVCPQCGQKYVKSRQDLALFGHQSG